MSDQPLNVLAVVGSLHAASVTRVVVNHIAQRLSAAGCSVDVLDLGMEPQPLYNPDSAGDQIGFPALKAR